MSIWLRWDSEDPTILHQVFEAGWTLQAYWHSIEALEVMIRDCEHPVRLIMDLSAASTMPRRIARGRQIDEAAATHNVDRLILVQPGHFMPVVNCPVDTASSREEAIDMLQLVDGIAQTA